MPNFREERRKYLLNHPCVDCGESDPVVLTFDHRDQSKKKCRINSLHSLRYEAKKCDVRCANCHLRLYSKQIRTGMEIARARGKRLGRPPVHKYTREEIVKLRKQGKSIKWIANNTRTSRGFVCQFLRSINSPNVNRQNAPTYAPMTHNQNDLQTTIQ